MRRRFGRRRQNGSAEEGRGGFDVTRALERIEAAGSLGVRGLTPLAVEGLPASSAAVGSGETESGERVLVAFAPRDATDAILAALAAASGRDDTETFAGTVLAIAPSWSLLARRRLALVGETPFTLRAVEAPDLGEGGECVLPEPLEDVPWLSCQQLCAHLPSASDRELAERAIQGLSGLAAKHGGTIRTRGRCVELVLLARRVAAVRIDEDGVLLDTLQPARRSERLRAEDLGDALDRLEGGLRKRLHDRSVRDGEEGLRTRAIPALSSLLGLRAVAPWPQGGGDTEAVDLVGIDGDGHPVVGAIRERLGLAVLGPVLDALIALRPALAGILAEALPPVRLETPRLALAAASLDAVVPRVMRWLALSTTFIEVRRAGGREPELVLGEATSAAVPARRARSERAEGARAAERGTRAATASQGGRREKWPREAARGAAEPDARHAPEAESPTAAPTAPFEEVSLFDLDVVGDGSAREATSDGEAGGARRRRRRRGRGRGRGRSHGTDAGERDGGADEAEHAPRAGDERRADAEAARRQRQRPEPERGAQAPRARDEDADDESDLDDTLAPLSPDVPEFAEELEVSFDEDDEADEESDPETERMHRERELRRRARVAKAAPPVPHEALRERPKRLARIAILAHADRDSLVAAILLARDLRLLEGIWVYPQSELMTFFRSVATDFHETTPIHVIGFSASPARDVLQAASLYRDRLVWYDHHSWPPEDVERLKTSIGSEAVHVTPGTRSSLPAVLAQCGRRSRFSDKLVDLVFARFSHHDYERWGRVWWAKLDAIAARSGERRADLEPLLIGRPSDLARQASAAEAPPPPPEVDFVAGQDFRLAHFSGRGLVVVPVPAALDPHLAARIARERYGASLSLAWIEGEETVVLAADEMPGRRALDAGSMAEHLASKHAWIDALPDADHVARFTVRDLARHPERIDEVLAEIAMGRSILEG